MILKNKTLLKKALARHIRKPGKCLLAQMCWPKRPANQMKYLEEQYGIPIRLLRLIEGLYVALPATEQPKWVANLLATVENGTDLSLVVNHFLIWLLTDPQEGVIIYATRPDVKSCIEDVSNLHFRIISGESVTSEAWAASGAASRAAARAASRAASEAAWAASRAKLESLLQSCSG